MGSKVRGSGSGARMYGLVSQLILIIVISLGMLRHGPGHSFRDQLLYPVFWAIVVGLALLAARTVVVGVYFRADRVLVRSWFRTYSYPLDELRRCDTEPWQSWITRGHSSTILQELSFSEVRDGHRRSRAFPVTVAGRQYSRQQAAVINAYLAAAAAAGSSRRLAHDHARGRAWKATVTATRATQERLAAKNSLDAVGLSQLPDAPIASLATERPSRTPHDTSSAPEPANLPAPAEPATLPTVPKPDPGPEPQTDRPRDEDRSGLRD
ncbi:hypothetical protein [Leifsonia poae]|uniref:hypothetical protein n=1 Tax=Leifsonia poae TaxID=110933 RepID=UPI001CC18E51|nr:hypothetical protein [Leifsonia poae]